MRQILTSRDNWATTCMLGMVAALVASTGCDSESRESALHTVSGPIYNGSSSWNADVVALTAAQGRAVGSVFLRGNNGGFQNDCTATLVADDVVLTAAHCIYSGFGPGQGQAVAPDDVQFAVGADVQSPDSVHPVASVTVHPSYDPNGETAIHDVAVLRLTTPISASNAGNLEPIPVSCEPLNTGELVGDTIQAGGYGATNPAGDAWTTLQSWIPIEVIDLTSIDFTVDGNGAGGVCYGDSGGPALWTMPDGVVRVIGVLSWGDAICGRQDHYVRTDSECDFIAPFLPDPCAGDEPCDVEPEPDTTDSDTGASDVAADAGEDDTEAGPVDVGVDGDLEPGARVLVRGGGCQGGPPTPWWVMLLGLGPLVWSRQRQRTS